MKTIDFFKAKQVIQMNYRNTLSEKAPIGVPTNNSAKNL